jgi:hypothetical protein
MRSRFRVALLIIDLSAAATIAALFIWGLRGVHRFPTEAAIYVTVLVVLLLANAAYLWRERGSSAG